MTVSVGRIKGILGSITAIAEIFYIYVLYLRIAARGNGQACVLYVRAPAPVLYLRSPSSRLRES